MEASLINVNLNQNTSHTEKRTTPTQNPVDNAAAPLIDAQGTAGNRRHEYEFSNRPPIPTPRVTKENAESHRETYPAPNQTLRQTVSNEFYSDPTTNMLARVLVRQKIPDLEPDIFDGDPIEFHPWKTLFKSIIDEAPVTAAEELAMLVKYTKSKPRELVNSFRQGEITRSVD